MTNKQAYKKAYKDAMSDVEAQLTASIRKNGGAKTAHQITNVLNELIIYLHEELRAEKEDEQEEQEAFNVMHHVINDIIKTLEGAR